MKKILLGVLGLVGLFITMLAVIIAVNYFKTGLNPEIVEGKNLKTAPHQIEILNWNLGYAGLGAASDFIADGGQNYHPPSKQAVLDNLAGIQEIIVANPADIYFFQEVSKPDGLTLGVDVASGVRSVLPDLSMMYSTDIATKFIPTKYSAHHGLSMMSTLQMAEPQFIRLIQEPTRYSGILKRQYHLQLREFTNQSGEQWAVFNLHLSAFDEGGNVRIKQFEQVLAIIEKYYKQGKHVVIGGDWNMQLTKTDFTYITDDKYLFWLTKMPKNLIPNGWELGFDPNVATCRTNEKPFVAGENYTTIIDGYLVSPNVKIVSVDTIDTNFAYTDHQAVFGVFESKAIIKEMAEP